MFHSQNGLYFRREENGDVTIIKAEGGTPGDGGSIVFEQRIDAGIWVSAILTMTHFNERSGDWPLFIKHHNGKEDVLLKEESVAKTLRMCIDTDILSMDTMSELLAKKTALEKENGRLSDVANAARAIVDVDLSSAPQATRRINFVLKVAELFDAVRAYNAAEGEGT